MSGPMELAIGPLLFNWPAAQVETFYARIADEASAGTVYLGEVVCGKRKPLLQDVLARAAERLEAAGKTVIWSTLAIPSTPRERRLAAELAADPDHLIEAGLVEWHIALAQLGYARAVHIHTRYVMTDVCQASRGDKADIATSKY